jgi:hypothetical protein
VRWLAKIVTVFMLLLMGVPAVACMLPNMEMSPEERACCRKMAGQCGEMGMDPSHGCCARLQHDDNQFLQNDQRVRGSVESAGLFITADSITLAPLALPVFAPLALEHSPPESPPHLFSILRI